MSDPKSPSERAVRPLPTMIRGVPVEPCREPSEWHGGLWQCMVGNDGSVWEFDLWSGRAFRTMEASDDGDDE